MPRLRVCLLWHMHQPMYRDPLSGEYILPWVRLHATRAYYDMARVLSANEGARAVVNFVPSLLAQLDDYASGRARDRFLDLTARPAQDLSPGEREFVVRNFFQIDWETNVRPLPRYLDLLSKRGRDLRTLDLAGAARSFSTEEVRDLQVLFNLGWMGFSAEEEEPLVSALRRKGRGFSEDDKRSLLEVQRRIIGRVAPAYAAVARSGQAELTVTPFYHPILPLLIDTEVARRAMPHAELPPRFSWPEDAAAQVRKALDYAQAHLGTRPQGMWPAEGSVSPEAIAVLADEGVRWCATDEGVLLRSSPPRERGGGTLYRPYRAGAAGREVAMLFRDHGLSDLIGFTYQKSDARGAVDDLFKHLDVIARAAPRGEVPLVTIALDGENAWEHYPSSGRDFLRLLYARLAAREGGFEPVKAGEYLAEHPPQERIDGLHTGSWIDANFRIWIGHPEDNAAWAFLREARRAIAAREAAAGGDAALREKVQAAKEALYAAEGSDWFWWYGDDFTTDSAAEFDALFRGYVRAAWQALGEPAPAALDEAIKRAALPVAKADALAEPQGFIRPRLDGKVLSYFDWTGAGLYLPHEAQGSMHQGDGLFAALRYGFDERTLYLRLDPLGTALDACARASLVQVQVGSGEKRVRIHVALKIGESVPLLREGAAEPRSAGQASLHDILELGVPFAALGFPSGVRVALSVQILREGIEVERLPRGGYLSFTVPDADYERRNWKV
jgi:alpha-amylase/alpha-mannosidase (GH57 family)